MACYLPVILQDGSTMQAFTGRSGKLSIGLQGGGAVEILNVPNLPSDEDGEFPLYDLNGLPLFTVPYVCDVTGGGEAIITKSAGKIGGMSQAGAVEAGLTSSGATIGKVLI